MSEQADYAEIRKEEKRTKLFNFSEKNKKSLIKLAGLLTVGLFFMLLASTLSPQPEQETIALPTEEVETSALPTYDEDYLEQKVAKMLSAINGIDNVSVSLTFSHGYRNEYASDISQSSREISENDSQGGTRSTTEQDTSQQLVVPTSAGQPVLISQTLPVVQGVVVSATGLNQGENALLVTRALQSLLAVDANKIVLCPAKIK